ncbi:MAG: hypothetical protein Q4G67_05785 [Actinomycetia bacterium]|nr:hypothetical protein [Actinomycetes bacterium]
MRSRRVYFALTHDQLQTLADERELPSGLEGFTAVEIAGVDARLSPAAAREEAEFVAFSAAAGPDSGSGAGGAARRIVLSADLPRASLQDRPDFADGALGVVTTEVLPLRLVASVHIDEAGTGEQPAELLWFDVTELEAVIEELAGP